jgi:hypothetical protein
MLPRRPIDWTFALTEELPIAIPDQRCEMKIPTSLVELQNTLGVPSTETLESLRLLKAFLKLTPSQRCEIIEMVEGLAADSAPAPGRPLS